MFFRLLGWLPGCFSAVSQRFSRGPLVAFFGCFVLAKVFCRAKFWAKFPFWRGAVRGEVFSRSLPRSFSRSFRPCFAGIFRAKKNFSKNFSPKFPWPCTAKLEKFQGKTSRRGSAEGPSPSFVHGPAFGSSVAGPADRTPFFRNFQIFPQDLRNLFPLSYSIRKHPEPQICPKICPRDYFGGFQSGGPSKFVKNLSEIAVRIFFSLTKCSQISDPPTDWLEPPKNNPWDKFWTNLGFGAFSNAVRGKRFRKSWISLKIRGFVQTE